MIRRTSREVAEIQDTQILLEHRRYRQKYVNTGQCKIVRPSSFGETTCPVCGEQFIKKAHNHKYCSYGCREIAYEKPTPTLKDLTKQELINKFTALCRAHAVLKKKYIGVMLRLKELSK